MVQGTGSSVGKSLLVTGLCRLFAQDGYRVAPFKAQNMSLNSAVTRDGLEIGRAQAVQADAARVEASVEMNPVLLKPEGDSVSQLVAMGRMDGKIHSMDFLRRRERLWGYITSALDALRARFDIVVIEGAGSPAEINLRAGDIVNMEVALYANAPVFLVGDIDKGGVFASLYGTLALIDERERRLVSGFIINKFRGDMTLLEPGLEMIEELAGVPVAGVLPYLEDVYVPEEDSPKQARTSADVDGALDVAIVALPRMANFDEFDPLARRSAVRLRYVRSAAEFGAPDLAILPGSKTTVDDLAALRRSGLAERVLRHLAGGGRLVGVCGGMQMLGNTIRDPLGIESAKPVERGLGVLDIDTLFAADKTTRRTRGRVVAGKGLLAGCEGERFEGYEIHVGVSDAAGDAKPALAALGDESPLGFADDSGRILATYVHDLFKNDAITDAIVNNLLAAKGLSALAESDDGFSQGAEYDKLAARLRQYLDIGAVYGAMGLA